MTKFKAGDTVECVDAAGSGVSWAKRGEKYKVISTGAYMFAVEGQRSPAFNDAFKLVHKPETVSAQIDAILTPAAKPASDSVHRPSHYARWKIEPIRFIEENGLPFGIGNVIKYVMRYDAKDGIQDLKKARRYLDMIIARLEGEADWNA